MDIKETLSNINLNLNVNNIEDYLQNLAKQKKSTTKNSKTKKINYFKYNIDKVVNTDFHELKNKNISNVNVCCFRIIESTKYSEVLFPYLEFLLFKYPENKKKESNLCLFPFFQVKKKDSINESKDKSIFNKQYNCLGYVIENDVFYFIK